MKRWLSLLLVLVILVSVLSGCTSKKTTLSLRKYFLETISGTWSCNYNGDISRCDGLYAELSPDGSKITLFIRKGIDIETKVYTITWDTFEDSAIAARKNLKYPYPNFAIGHLDDNENYQIAVHLVQKYEDYEMQGADEFDIVLQTAESDYIDLSRVVPQKLDVPDKIAGTWVLNDAHDKTPIAQEFTITPDGRLFLFNRLYTLKEEDHLWIEGADNFDQIYGTVEDAGIAVYENRDGKDLLALKIDDHLFPQYYTRSPYDTGSPAAQTEDSGSAAETSSSTAETAPSSSHTESAVVKEESTADKPAAEPKKIAMDESAAVSFAEITFNSVSIEEDIKKSIRTGNTTRTFGPNPESGYRFIALEGRIKNTGKTALPVYDFFLGEFDINGYTYECTANQCYVYNSEGQTLTSIEALAEYDFIMYAKIPDALDTSGKKTFRFGFYDNFDNYQLSINRSSQKDPISLCQYQFIIDPLK